MLHIKEAIVVEGKYDKEQLRKITDAPIICTNGFHLYRSKAIIDSIRRFAKENGIIILTDSDGAGFRIRNYLKSCLGTECTIKNAYIPAIHGKEKRKDHAGKEGLLGVEGIDIKQLEKILRTAATPTEARENVPVTKANFFEDGLTGKPDSTQRRACLIRKLKLPPKLSSNALLDLLNQIGGLPVYRDALKNLHRK